MRSRPPYVPGWFTSTLGPGVDIGGDEEAVDALLLRLLGQRGRDDGFDQRSLLLLDGFDDLTEIVPSLAHVEAVAARRLGHRQGESPCLDVLNPLVAESQRVHGELRIEAVPVD